MNKDDIIRMAMEAGAKPSHHPELWDIWNIRDTDLERFAKLVAVHTLSNIDPSKFISHQESFEAGQLSEREACAQVCEAGVVQTSDWDASYWNQACENRAAAIRARGEK